MNVVIDDFFDNYEAVETYARTRKYGPVVNPEDGVEYPDICPDVPKVLLEEMVQKLEKRTGEKLVPKTSFFRLTHKGTNAAPHGAHTDTVMGRYTCLVYLQDSPEGVAAGTALVRHAQTEGLQTDPWTPQEHIIWERDMNEYDAWTIKHMIPMRANRLAFYDSKIMHRAEPEGGFGESLEDGRLVLTVFFERDNG